MRKRNFTETEIKEKIKEIYKANMTKYRENNREKYNAYYRDYYRKHREKIRQYRVASLRNKAIKLLEAELKNKEM